MALDTFALMRRVSRLRYGELPPCTRIKGDISAAPEIEGNVGHDRDKECDPEPYVFTKEPPHEERLPNPAPVLQSKFINRERKVVE